MGRKESNKRKVQLCKNCWADFHQTLHERSVASKLPVFLHYYQNCQDGSDRADKSQSIRLLTRQAVKTGLNSLFWSIGGRLKWLIGSFKSQAHMPSCPLDIIVNVVQLLLHGFFLTCYIRLFLCTCVNIVVETLQPSI